MAQDADGREIVPQGETVASWGAHQGYPEAGALQNDESVEESDLERLKGEYTTEFMKIMNEAPESASLEAMEDEMFEIDSNHRDAVSAAEVDGPKPPRFYELLSEVNKLTNSIIERDGAKLKEIDAQIEKLEEAGIK